MDQENSKAQAEGICHLLSHLHGEIADLEKSYSRVILVLQDLQTLPDAREINQLEQQLGRSRFFGQWNALLDACEKANAEAGEVLFEGLDALRSVGPETRDLPPELARLEAMIRAYG